MSHRERDAGSPTVGNDAAGRRRPPGLWRGRAEEIFLAWLLALPPEADPSPAATAVLAQIESLAGPDAGDRELKRLRALLEETMSWTPQALATLPPPRGAGREARRRSPRRREAESHPARPSKRPAPAAGSGPP
jgi:hypothetical protein